MAGRNSLDIVSVLEPCDVPWGEMAGDSHVRHCGKCERNVYDLSSLTRVAAEALVAEREGGMCVRFYRRADGTLSTKNCDPRYEAPAEEMLVMGLMMVPVALHAIPEERVERDLLLATVGRSLRRTLPEQADAMLVLVEKTLLPPTSNAARSARCANCDQPLRFAAEPSAPTDGSADRDGLLERLRQCLEATHPQQLAFIMREARRRDAFRESDGTLSCVGCGNALIEPVGANTKALGGRNDVA